MEESEYIHVSAEMFRKAMHEVSKVPLTVRVARFPNGHKKIVLTQTLCNALGAPFKEVEFGCVAKGELAMLDDDELVNVITEALSQGLLSSELRMDKTND